MNPRYYQTAANDAAWQFLAEKPGNPLIVLPTGAGKSLVIAMLAKQALEFGGRVVVLAHRKELLQQNAEKIRVLLPGVDVGIFSAGLKSRETSQDVLCAGIQSVYRKASEIGPRHLIIVDEAHLISQDEDSMYGSFIADILKANPKARVVGATATPFRTGEGPICGPDKLFRRICYEAQTGKLIQEGFLCPITNKAAESSVNTDSLAIRGGEFIEGDVQKLFSAGDAVKDACFEIKERCHDRHSILVFASGVQHAENVAELLREITADDVGVVTGETLSIERSETLRRFRNGELRWLVSVDCLTTGFDAPCIDAIAVLRATMSPGLFAQMIGRGLRKHESKQNCIAEGQLVLTDHGLVEIQLVKTHMKVWDGVEFVSHCGIIFQGESDVISYAGLTATEDHNVWTKEGWMPLGIAKLKKAEIAVTGCSEQAVRQSENCFRGDCQEEQVQAVCSGRVHRVRQEGMEVLSLRSEMHGGMPEVRQETKFSKAMPWCSKVASYALYFCKRTVHKQKLFRMEKLRRTWDYIRVQVSERNGIIPDAELLNSTKSGNRQDRQRQRLCSGECSRSITEGECEQSPWTAKHKQDAQIQIDASECSLCGLNADSSTVKDDIQRGCRQVSKEERQAKRRVWDILNAGPRNRFTCEGLLVSNCYVLDFGENIKRHGSLDDASYGRASAEASAKQRAAAEANGRGKPCPACGMDSPSKAPACIECGFAFPTKERHGSKSDDGSTLTGEYPPEQWTVESVAWGRHTKKSDPDAPPTLRVDYTVKPLEGGLIPKTVSEWVCFEHTGFARTKACLWWQARSIADVPDSVEESLSLLKRGACRTPLQLITVRDGKYTRIKEVMFCDERPEEWAEEAEEEVLEGFFGEDTEVPF